MLTITSDAFHLGGQTFTRTEADATAGKNLPFAPAGETWVVSFDETPSFRLSQGDQSPLETAEDLRATFTADLADQIRSNRVPEGIQPLSAGELETRALNHDRRRYTLVAKLMLYAYPKGPRARELKELIAALRRVKTREDMPFIPWEAELSGLDLS